MIFGMHNINESRNYFLLSENLRKFALVDKT